MKGRIRIVFLTTLLFAIWYHLYQQGVRKASAQELSWASAVYFLCCIPILNYFGAKERTIPYVPFISFIYFCYFALGIFNSYELFAFHGCIPPAIVKTLILTVAGLASFLVSFYGYPGKLVQTIVPHLTIPLDHAKNNRLVLRIFIMAFIIQYHLTAGHRNFGQFRQFFEQLPAITISLFYLMQLRGYLKLKGKIMLWLMLIPLRFLCILSAGGFAGVAYEISIMYFIYLFCRNRVPWLSLVVILPILFVIWGARDEFRTLTWGAGRYAHYNTFKKSFLYLKLARDRALKRETTDTDRAAYDRLAARTNHLVTFVKTVELTPSRVPYWGGATYATLPYGLLPRFIFPSKPKKLVGQDFGHRYMFLNPHDKVTSYNLPILVEMYINFGPIGVVIGMFIFGLVLRVLYALINHPQCGDGGFMIGATLFSSLLNIESDFSLIFGNVFQYTIIFYILVKRFIIPDSQAIKASP